MTNNLTGLWATIWTKHGGHAPH